jgi:hypothetical protein
VDRAGKLREPTELVGVRRVFLKKLQVGDEPMDVDQIRTAVTDHLIRDVYAAALRIPRLHCAHSTDERDPQRLPNASYERRSAPSER